MPGRGGGYGCGRHRRRIRGFLEPCLLLILRQGKSHGYDLKGDLEPFGLGEVNPSLVYRALRDMEEEGLVTSQWDTEGSAGPARRVYQMTELGTARLEQWIAELHETDRFLHRFLHEAESSPDQAA